MANLGKKNGTFLARFRFGGREYKRSLKTSDRGDAVAAMHDIERVLHRLAVGMLRLPEGIDPGDFVVSGGTLKVQDTHERPPAPTVTAAITEYLDHLMHLAETNRYTIRVHLNNFKKYLGSRIDVPIDHVAHAELDGFLQARLKERSPTTVSKERDTLIHLFDWAAARDYLQASPTTRLRKIKGSSELDPFRTLEEIRILIERGGLERDRLLALWDCLYLTPQEIAGLLQLVRNRSRLAVSFVLHTIPAYTGMRRGEVLRLRWSDIEFEHDSLIARSKKQSRQEVETKRRIDLHPELKAILLDWRDNRAKGQFVACDDSCLEPLTPRLANSRFWQPLRGTSWCLNSRKNLFCVGFHTYRHSLASNLAASGVDQRIIDQWLGHMSEAMRKRYRHLFPRTRRSAIESFSLSPSGG